MDSIGIHRSFVTGDLENLKKLLGYPEGFPNIAYNAVFGNILEYAIYHSPLSFVSKLLSLGADPNYPDGSYPSILAALSADSPDKPDLIRLLISFGADIQMRGINDYTPLHYAASLDDPEAVRLLLYLGADRNARTDIDEYATPLEEARILGCHKAVEALLDSDTKE
ncbi:ankyrin repeat domain-containing protein [Youngiibacter fragilis]|uniref:Ankyrin n=1 Tax=Youngiibacter fragilis 232.1 TaxID=994573 RepID=V7I155_9CLOT|nr:ankyrin repeat domain-containing protein [Youngiibacter fragilis]ETA78929.1 ankyrin [Youngiibacter fragilis 232.1]